MPHAARAHDAAGGMTMPGQRTGAHQSGFGQADPGSTLLWADLIADGLLAAVGGTQAGDTEWTRPPSRTGEPPRIHPSGPALTAALPGLAPVPPVPAAPAAELPARPPAVAALPDPPESPAVPTGFAAPSVPAGPAPVPAAAPLDVRPGPGGAESSGGALRPVAPRADVVTGRAVNGLNRADRESPSAELALRLALRSSDTELSLAVGTLLSERSRDRERVRRLDSALRAVLALGELSPGAVALLRALTVSGP